MCAECADYQRGLAAGARSMREPEPVPGMLDRSGVAYCATDGPLGELQLAASADGLVRLAFEEHGDFAEMSARASSRRGGEAARAHVRTAIEELERFFSGELTRFTSPLDWSALSAPLAGALRAVGLIPYGRHRSYSNLGLELPARDIGHGYGANPIPLLTPCHRVTRGVETPDVFVGGVERRRWLDAHERRHAAG